MTGLVMAGATAVIMLAAAVSVPQGSVFRVEVPPEIGLTGVTAEWRDRAVPLFRDDKFRDGNWTAVLGADLDDAPGDHPVALTLVYTNGRERSSTTVIDVNAGEYPTTHLTVEPKYVELSEENQQRAARERAEIDAVYATVTSERLWNEPFVVPVAGVSGGRNFGHRRVFNDQPRSPHSGADLKASTGTPILSANRGRVVMAKNLFFSGNAVFVDHGLGIVSVYAHLSAIDIEVGELVERGDVIGLAGETGRVTGPHLHWGIRAQGARVDPFSLLELDGAAEEN
jgi:murein DD-endopeptidase MepM/ murein hydrolase activator NlpD